MVSNNFRMGPATWPPLLASAMIKMEKQDKAAGTPKARLALRGTRGCGGASAELLSESGEKAFPHKAGGKRSDLGRAPRSAWRAHSYGEVGERRGDERKEAAVSASRRGPWRL